MKGQAGPTSGRLRTGGQHRGEEVAGGAWTPSTACQSHLPPHACLLQIGLTPPPWALGGGLTLVKGQVPPEWCSGAAVTANTASRSQEADAAGICHTRGRA